MPKISVIVPVYNVENYLHRCVDSILAQTISDFELILVDDGSPDQSGAICEEYAMTDSRVKVIHKENGGLSSARNVGIDTAAGEYLMFVDSDDWIHPDCLQILMECIERNEAAMAIGEFSRFEGELPDTEQFTQWNKRYRTVSGQETLAMYFDGRESMHSIVSACCKLFRRELFEEIRFPVGRLFEDEFTVYKLYYKAHKIAFSDAVLYYYFVNNQGITGTLTLEKRLDEYDAQWERLCFFEKHHLEELYNTALLTFLNTARWDLIAYRKQQGTVSTTKGTQFENRYETVFDIARRRHVLQFLRDYDYYVLAKPKWTLWWRIRRICSQRKFR